MAELPIDFVGLQEINPEIYAWIEIPDTKINYPILQHEGEDQAYYLTRDLYGASNQAGSIYTEDYNNKDFQDYHTVLYGHNMKNGSMFGRLRKFRNSEFCKENPYFYIYTPDGKEITYHIYSVAVVKDDADTYKISFASDPNYQAFIDFTYSSAEYTTGVEVSTDEEIVTLSTCTASSDDHRLVVHGVKIQEISLED